MNIIMQHSHINYPPSYEIVTDGRVLNALVKRGLIDEWDKIHKYINEYKMDRLSSDDRIIYNNNDYVIKYIKYNSVVNWGYCYNENLNSKGGANVE